MEEKIYYTVEDVQERYGVGTTIAYRILRETKKLCGDSLGAGKVLRTELERWERARAGEKASKEAGAGNAWTKIACDAVGNTYMITKDGTVVPLQIVEARG